MITEFDVYQFEAKQSMRPGMSEEAMNNYFAMKICEEAGEIVGAISKHYVHGKPLDKENVKEEISDLLWYLANLADLHGFKLSEVATYNIEKLRKRHGESYNNEFYTKSK